VELTPALFHPSQADVQGRLRMGPRGARAPSHEREIVRVAAPVLGSVGDDLAATVDKRLQIVADRKTNLS
jgi:hypothetical protein